MDEESWYQKYAMVFIGLFGSAGMLGLTMVLLCGFVVYVRRPGPSVIAFVTNIMVAHIMCIFASIPSKGFLAILPYNMDEITCIVSTFFSETGFYATMLFFLYMVLDNVYHAFSRIETSSARLKNSLCIIVMCWILAISMAIPISFFSVSVPSYRGLPAMCRVSLVQSMLDMMLKLCYIAIFPFCVITFAIIQAAHTGDVILMRSLSKRIAAFYITIFLLQMPYLVSRALRDSLIKPTDKLNIFDYLEIAFENISLLRFIIIPVFAMVLSSHSPIDDIDRAALILGNALVKLFVKGKDSNGDIITIYGGLWMFVVRYVKLCLKVTTGNRLQRNQIEEDCFGVDELRYPIESLPTNFVDGSLETIVSEHDTERTASVEDGVVNSI